MKKQPWFSSLGRLLCLLLASAVLQSAAANQHVTPEDYWRGLLEQTRSANVERRLTEEAYLQLAQQDTQTQAQALAEVQAALAAAEQRQADLEQEQLTLEAELQETQERLQRRSASLGEVFAIYREEKSNLFGLVSDAFYRHQYPELMAFLQPSSTSERLPSVQDFETLWQSLQQAWIATGQVVSYQGDWIDPQGQQQTDRLTRLGDLQLMQAAGMLRLRDQQPPALWPRQSSGLRQSAASFSAGQTASVVLDPARGMTLQLLSRQPTLIERVQQGGFVGYLILLLGLLGLLVAAVQSVRLLAEYRRVKNQLGQLDQPQANNALGRVMAALQSSYQQAQQQPPEALEARLDEMLVRESAALERGLALVKLLAAMAPLLGLLGTVTGMIATFQAITLFGTGDPAMMAAGISQALVTTVLGLLTAVPLLLAHLLLQGRSRLVARLLEAESSAWLAATLATRSTCPRGGV
ncbi:MotA/TolQ/ExbB proton channel family protein [Marinospirillum sp.]|uniref:MotA/TolQ/ExbB proton channel family protein n=1 Tax=Marinospirillum sp. TaxID=2183934 RepID=UPI003A852E63